MKKTEPEKSKTDADDVLPEYDFSGGVRGKHHRAYREGHVVRVHDADGSVTEQHFTLEEGAVMLEPDVREYFPDSEAVNNALRALIAISPTKAKRKASGTAAKKRLAGDVR